MTGFDFSAAAALLSYPDNRPPMCCLRFECAADAIRHAIEQLSAESLRGSVLEVDDQRYDAGVIQMLYASDDFPLARSHPKFRVPPNMWAPAETARYRAEQRRRRVHLLSRKL